MTALGWLASTLRKADRSKASSVSSVLPQTRMGPAPDSIKFWRRLSTTAGAGGGVTSNFKFPLTRTRLRSAPILMRRF